MSAADTRRLTAPMELEAGTEPAEHRRLAADPTRATDAAMMTGDAAMTGRSGTDPVHHAQPAPGQPTDAAPTQADAAPIDPAPAGAAPAEGDAAPAEGDPPPTAPPAGEAQAGVPPDRLGPVVDRQGAFAAGIPKMPRRVIYGAVAVILGIGLAGSLADRFFFGSGGASTSATQAVVPAVRPAVPVNAKQLSAPMATFLGLVKLKSHPAPALPLTQAGTGSHFSLGDLRGHVVVLTFANAACNDICPVLASELRQVDAQLATPPVAVTFVTVNTDPLDHATTGAAILSQPTLATLTNWRFLTGSVKRLNPVWKHYDIGITARRSTHVASHNDFLYVIAPDGKLAWRATPFANESTKGKFSLPASETARFARGIARVADYVVQGK